jgi:ABC-type antimicrobial peptide transport system permease subunit
VDRTTAPQRIATLMAGLFGVLAAILAAIGLYGVMSYTVSQSSRELALRLALGAKSADLLRLILWQAAQLTAAALVVGSLAALGLSNWLSNMFYNVSPRDATAFSGAFGVIALACLAACVLPALRAMRTSPIDALKA